MFDADETVVHLDRKRESEGQRIRDRTTLRGGNHQWRVHPVTNSHHCKGQRICPGFCITTTVWRTKRSMMIVRRNRAKASQRDRSIIIHSFE